MKRVKVAAIIILLSVLSAGRCLAEEPVGPERIISLSPGVTRQIYLLGAEDRLVGVTSYCQRPLAAQKKTRVGTLLEFNLEKVVELEPDLVLSTSLTNRNSKQRLKELGVKVVDFPQARNFDGLCAQFLELGRIVGKEEQAGRIVHQAKKEAAAIKQKAQGLSRPKVFIQVGTEPLFTITDDSFFNDFVQFAGGTNIAAGANSGLYSREVVLAEDPDVIIITTMGIVGEKEKQIWRNFPVLQAVKNKRIYIVDEYQFCSPTPMSFIESLQEMLDILHPEIKDE